MAILYKKSVFCNKVNKESNEVNVLKEEIKLLQMELEAKKVEAVKLERSVKESDERSESELRKFDTIIKEKEDQIKQLNEAVMKTNAILDDSEIYIRKLKRFLRNQDDVIMKLREERNELKGKELEKKRRQNEEDEQKFIRKRVRIEEEERLKMKDELKRKLK